MYDVATKPVAYSTCPLTPAQVRRINVAVKLRYGLPLTWQERAGEALGRLAARLRRSIGR